MLQRTQQPPPRRRQQPLRLMQAQEARRVPRKTRRRMLRARHRRRPRRMRLLGPSHHRRSRPQRINPVTPVRTELPLVRQQSPRQVPRKLRRLSRTKIPRRRREPRNRDPLRPRSCLLKHHLPLPHRLNLPRILLVHPVANKRALVRGRPQTEPLQRSRNRSQRVRQPSKQRSRATQAKTPSRSSSPLQQLRKLVLRRLALSRPSRRRGYRSQATALLPRKMQTVEPTTRR